jgi:hypothetical protein
MVTEGCTERAIINAALECELTHEPRRELRLEEKRASSTPRLIRPV